MVITTGQLALADIILTQIITLTEKLAKVKIMSAEEVDKALVKENERSKQLIDLLRTD